MLLLSSLKLLKGAGLSHGFVFESSACSIVIEAAHYCAGMVFWRGHYLRTVFQILNTVCFFSVLKMGTVYHNAGINTQYQIIISICMHMTRDKIGESRRDRIMKDLVN